MRKMLGSHIRGNVVGYVALFFALSGGMAWATHPGGANTISSGDIQDNQVFGGDIQDNQVSSADVRNDTLVGGGLAVADLRASSVGTSEVAADSLGAGDLAPNSVGTDEVADDSLMALDLAPNSVGTSEVANDSLSGADIANTNSLTGPEIDEASLEGVARARSTNASGTSACCEIIARQVTTGDPYALFNFATWVDLGRFELRAPASDNSAGSGFRLCNTTTTAAFRVIIYVGGAFGATSDTRSHPVVGAGACTAVDYNGASTDAFGDFRLTLPVDDVVVFGDGDGTASNASIRVIAIDS